MTVPFSSPPDSGVVAPKVKPVKIRKSKPGTSAKKINSAETNGVTSGWFLDRTADAALKQYSREEDRWILDQVRAPSSTSSGQSSFLTDLLSSPCISLFSSLFGCTAIYPKIISELNP